MPQAAPHPEPGENSKNMERRAYLLMLLSPALIAILLMLPRLLSSQFGLFDDALMLRTVEQLRGGDWNTWDIAGGRFRPAYWIHWTIFHLIGGDQSIFFFLGNTISLAASASLLSAIVYRLRKDRLLAWASAMLFLLAGPVIESFYTLGKGEPYQVLWLLVSIFLLLKSLDIQNRFLKGAALFGSVVTCTLALLTKETTLVILPISIAWLGYVWIKNKITKRPEPLLARITYVGLVVASVAFYFLFRSYYLDQLTATTGYASNYLLSIENFVASIIRYSGWTIRFFLYLLPLLIPLLIKSFRKRILGDPFFLDALIWSGGWLFVFLPWSTAVGYFLLPFSVGAATTSAILIVQIWRYSRSEQGARRIISMASLSLAMLILTTTLFTNRSLAQIQLHVDDANQNMMEMIAREAPKNATIWINIQNENEYVSELRIHLNEVQQRPDLEIAHIQSNELTQFRTDPNHLILLPSIENEILLGVRMGVIEEPLNTWNQAVLGEINSDHVLTYEGLESFRLSNFNLPGLFCPLLGQRGFCTSNAPFMDTRVFTYGWLIYTPVQD
jgi:hypothetical protein